ncbi:MAG TPA: sensor histidine kinase [Spirochaetia bacterium]|nr:sensor histidine kinase [Spirochaetia bacterium]
MLSRFLPAFRDIPIKRKLIITFVAFFIVPFLVSSVFFYLTSTNDITRRDYDRSRETLKLFQNSVEAQLRDSAIHSEEIYNDPRIFALMPRAVPPQFDEFQLFQMQQALMSFRASQNYAESAYIFFPNGQFVFADTSGGGRYAGVFLDHPAWKDSIQAADGRAYWIASVAIQSLHAPWEPINTVSFGRVLKNIYSSTFFNAGILVVNLKSQLFDDLGSSNELSGNGLVIITDREDNLVWCANRDWYAKVAEKYGLLSRLETRGGDALRKETLGGKSYFAAYVKSAYNEWHYVALIPESDILSQARVLRNYFMAILVLCLVLSALGAAVINRYVTSPIERLIVSMDRMGRDAAPRVRSGRAARRQHQESTDEIGFLSKSFHGMSERIENLIRETQDAHRREKEHEIRALQAQIDPHFLSNTLDTIAWIARERDEPRITRMLTALSRILQYSIGSAGGDGKAAAPETAPAGKLVRWQDEIQWLSNYVFLQQTRYENKLSVRYEIDESINDLKTFHLLLQPFVENAINHGFRDRQGEGLILIRGRLNHDQVIVEISDDGCGMSEAKIDQVFGGESRGIGIFNVHERIRLTFGPPYGVTVEPRPAGGTTVRICFPALRDEK